MEGLGGGVIGAVLTAAGGVIVYLWKTRHEQSRETRKDAIEEMRQLLNEQRTETESVKADMLAVRRELDEEREHRERCERQNERMRARIEYHEELMADKGIRFRPWTDEPSGPYRPLPPQPPEAK